MCEGNEGGDGVGVGVGWCLSGDKDFFDVILAKTHVTVGHHYLVHIHFSCFSLQPLNS